MKVSLNPLNNGGGVKANHSVELNRGLLLGSASLVFCRVASLVKKRKRERDREGV